MTAVIPLAGGKMLDAAAARFTGNRHLAAWLSDVEAKWAAAANRGKDGQPRMTLSARLDHMRTLSGQSRSASVERVLYTKSGTRLSAVRLLTTDAIVDHKAYWSSVRSTQEAAYLIAILNSAAALANITDLQSHGQRDKRDFDNLVWTLPIPEYDDTDPLHHDLAAAATIAETVAAAVDLAPYTHFTAKRRAIRAALAEHGIAAQIETLVAALLPP